MTDRSQLKIHPGSPDQCFVSYCLPGSTKVTTIIQDDPVPGHPDDLRDLESLEGFIIAAFPDQQKSPDLLIRPDQIFRHEQLENEAFTNVLPLSHDVVKNVDKASYVKFIEHAVDQLKTPALRKVVLSRTLNRPIPERFNCLTLFNALTRKYTDAFVYLFNVPGHGIWIGATPEVLLQVSGDKVQTVSLAGTKKTKGNQIQWTDKEVEEQELVSLFIEDLFRKYGIQQIDKSALGQKEAGKFAHLYTTFTVDRSALHGQVGNFIAELHPTPAVCGLPKESALEYIHQAEEHNREYYTGFLGPVGIEEETRLFVNLRCLKVTPGQFILFAGGGITAASIPEDEWEETCLKAGTMLEVIDRL